MAPFVDHKAADWRKRERGGGGKFTSIPRYHRCIFTHALNVNIIVNLGVKFDVNQRFIHVCVGMFSFGFYAGALAVDGKTGYKCMEGRCRPVSNTHAHLLSLTHCQLL